MTISLQPSVLRWARLRARLGVEELAAKFGKKDSEKWTRKIEQWEKHGDLTYREAEKLAHHTHTPFGYLFLDQAPVEKLPISDFRTAGSQSVQTMSTELLDVIYQSQRQQEWFRDYLLETGAEKPSFVCSFPPGKSIIKAAQSIQSHLAYHPSQCRESTFDAGAISKATFKRNYNDKLEEYRSTPKSKSRNFHNNQPWQIGRRFGTAVVASTLEGKTPLP